MKIFVKAKPSARSEKVEKVDDTHFRVAVKEPAREGRANTAIAKALARNFDIAPSRVKLVRGAASRNKVVEVGV